MKHNDLPLNSLAVGSSTSTSTSTEGQAGAPRPGSHGQAQGRVGLRFWLAIGADGAGRVLPGVEIL